MKDAQIEVPAAQDEVWRGAEEEGGETTHIAVAIVGGVPSPRFWCPSTTLPPGRWRDPAPAFGYRIMAAWALSEHARAEKASRRAAAEAALRRAEKAMYGVPSWTEQGRSRIAAYEEAKADLLALGGVP